VKSPTKYRKGRMGYMLDMRKEMSRLSEVTKEWCRAFDTGDEEAVGSLGELFKEIMGDFAKAAAGLEENNSE